MNLSSALTDLFRLTEPQKAALRKLQIRTVQDLLYHFPFRYDQAGGESSIEGLVPGTDASIIGTLEKMETKKSWKRKIPVTEGYVRDTTGRIKCMWFNQPYIAKMWMDGTLVRAIGKVGGSEGKIYLANPELQRVSLEEGGLFGGQQQGVALAQGSSRQRLSASDAQFFAIYPESSGMP